VWHQLLPSPHHLAIHLMDYYIVLQLSSDATLADIKRAYQSMLLVVHPDKRRLDSHPTPSSENMVTVDHIREAYATLSDPQKRMEYDRHYSGRTNSGGPRPAQVLSLEDLTEEENLERWTYPCRCGGMFAITEREMDAGVHLIGCISCSEVVWVGYELA
jgi:diphthamide biosynthesis protein 4